jgi:hypothetical protein
VGAVDAIAQIADSSIVIIFSAIRIVAQETAVLEPEILEAIVYKVRSPRVIKKPDRKNIARHHLSLVLRERLTRYGDF